MNSTRGAISLLLVAIVAVLCGGLLAFKPAWMSGDSSRAKASQEATARLLAAEKARSAAAAAGVAAIAKANSMAAPSPTKEFLEWEVPSVLSKLETPDPMELLAAEKRRSAVMEGRLEEAQRLYQTEAKHSTELREERDAAIADRQKADLEISEAAAAKLAAERQRNAFMIVVALLAAGVVYLKFFYSSPGSIAKMLVDIRSAPLGSKDTAVRAIDTYTFPWQQEKIRRLFERKITEQAAKKAAVSAAAAASVEP